jgi:hypothetical protein
MLKTLLGRSSDKFRDLEYYVIAAAFPKMLSRMNNHPISICYLACLIKVRTFEFTEQPLIAPMRADNRSRDQIFLDVIPDLADHVSTNIPNLKQVAKVAKAMEPFEVYTKDTCVEFHMLLCKLL